MNRIGLIWRTIRYLTLRQLVFQVLNRLRGRARLRFSEQPPTAYFLPVPNPNKPISWQHGTFTFLNQSVKFSTEIDWNYSELGSLWVYHLNYFDYLNQPMMTARTGLILIRDFIAQTDSLIIGLEPYPTSLRIRNWVHFVSHHQIQDEVINQHLFAQSSLLARRFEYHLAGNHLLENEFSLLTAALYFRQKRWFEKAAGLIRQELTSQILADGGHDERSPMYHQLLLDRVLNLLLILQSDTWHNDPSLVPFLAGKAASMLAWLHSISFRNGDVPMVNDAAWGIAPTTNQLHRKAVNIRPKLIQKSLPLSASGYRMFRRKWYELITDVGPVGSDHQPGHAHADTFSFVLYVDNQPMIVDTGTSTYAIGARRAWERSTIAHNTVSVRDANSSEVWAGFRVGRRARVTLLTDTETMLSASHDGFRLMEIIHKRTWLVGLNHLIITDSLLDTHTNEESSQIGTARFHFHPTIALQISADFVTAGVVKIIFHSATKPVFRVTTYPMANGFNRIDPGQCLEVDFTGSLETTIILNE